MDLEEDSVLAHADSVDLLGARELANTSRPWVLGKTINVWIQSLLDLSGKASQVAPRPGSQLNAVRHTALRKPQLRFDLLPGDRSLLLGFLQSLAGVS